jgi:hypothetical protein
MKFFICTLMGIVSLSLKAQVVNIKDKLQLHILFDNDSGKTIKVISYNNQPNRFRPALTHRINNTPRIYAQNDALKVGNRNDTLAIKNVSRLPFTLNFWMKVKTFNTRDRIIELGRFLVGDIVFHLREQRYLATDSSIISLVSYKPGTRNQILFKSDLEINRGTKDWQLITFQLDQEGKLKFALSNTILNDASLVIANPIASYSSPAITFTDTSKVKYHDLTFIFEKASNRREVFVDDISVYNKVLSKEELNAVASHDPYTGEYIGRYQLAFTQKQIADQYYLKASDINLANNSNAALYDSARYYYDKARKQLLSWVPDQVLYEKLLKFQFSSEEDIDTLSGYLERPDNKIRNSLAVKSYYELLLFDINYRFKLIESGYSFWGKDFTEKPLFPVQEYQFFTNTYSKFDVLYQKIDALLKYQGELDERQQMNELQSQLAAHRSEIEKVKMDQTQFKSSFYDQQLGHIDSRLKGIEQRQKDLNREVDRREKELKKLDAKIMSTLSGAISQATLGVSIDVTKDLKSQLTTAGLSYLGGDKALSTSLLGSYKDIYDVAITSREYYQKGKEVFETVKSIASGKITVDNVLKIGDAVSSSGFVDEAWTKDWNDIREKYKDAQEQYRRGKELLQKVKMTAKRPNMKNIVDFVDWMGQSEYIPENYRKDYQQFRNYREAAYNAVKNKRYNDIIELGLKMINDESLKSEVDRIREKVRSLKPAFIVVEMISKKQYGALKDSLIENILNGNVDQYVNEKVRNEYLFKILKLYLNQDTTHGQSHFESLIVTLLNQAPESILECFPYNVREDFSKLLQARSYQDLTDKLKRFKFSDFRDKVKAMHDTLFIYNEPYVMDISKYLNLRREDTKVIVKLFKENIELYKKLQEATTPLEVYKIFEEILVDGSNSKKRAEQFFTLMEGRLPEHLKDSILKEATAFYLGNGVFQAATDKDQSGNLIDSIPDLVDENNPQEILGENMGDMPQGDNSEMMRQMAAKALDMAFPGVGTALNTVLGIADAIFSGYQIVDELRTIYTEKVKLNDEYVKLLDNYRDNQFNKQLALYETRIANLSYNIMLEEHEGYSKIVNTIVDRKKDVRRKIGGYLPLMFFHAERLRYYYQRLNKASSFWYGADNTLNRIIFSDPNNLRFALDPDIKLFDWITSPDVTSSREDIFRLYSHWSKIHSLSTDGLISNRMKYGDNVSEISYQVFDLEAIDRNQWKEFRTWQRHPNTSFVYNLNLSYPLASNNVFGFDSSFTSIKTIQVIPLAIGDNNRKLGNVLTVSNLGLSTNEAGVVEPLARRSRSSSDEFIDMDANGNVNIPTYFTKNLKYRWDSPNNDYQPFNFEGYNLRSDWKVVVEPRTSVQDIKKIYFIVFYQYTKNYTNLNKSFSPEYLYRVKLNSNLLSGENEYLNVTLPTRPNQPPTDRFIALQKKYPYLFDRKRRSVLVQPEDITPYLQGGDESQPIILNVQGDSFKSFSRGKIEVKKKKCFLSRIF